jgi:hypothetical protein
MITAATSTTLVATGRTELTLIATWEAAILAKATGVKSREIRLIRTQSVAHSSVHHERFIGTIRGHLRREFGRGLALGEIRTGVGLLTVLSPAARSRSLCRHSGVRSQLERQIEVGGCGSHLDVAVQRIEPEHVGFDGPCARRHSVKPERAIIVRERDQASLALSRAHRRSGDRLATSLNSPRLCKYHWQAHCQKHENFEH